MKFRKTERVFIISIRKDIDTGIFEFPSPVRLQKVLQDCLDEEVDEKYYLSNEQLQKIEYSSFKQKKASIQSAGGGVCSTLLARDYKDPKCVCINQDKKIIQVADLKYYGNDQMNRVYSVHGVCPTIKTVSGGG